MARSNTTLAKWGISLAVRIPKAILGSRATQSRRRPSVLVFHEGFDDVCDLLRQIFAAHGCQSEVLATQAARTGFEKSVVE
jgi:hypothetical protein